MHVTLDTASNLSAGFLRGNPPDVGLLNYNMEMARFMERGALSDLSDMPEAERIRPEVQELVDQYATYPGRTSVLPYSVAAASVIYNVQIFEDNDIEVPTTWDELIAACDELEAAGVTPIYSTFKDPWTLGQGLFDYSAGGQMDVADFIDQMHELGTEVGPDSAVSFQKDVLEPSRADEAARRLLERRTPRAAATATATSPSRTARAAMYMQGPWALGEIAKTEPRPRARDLPAADDRRPRRPQGAGQPRPRALDPRGERRQGGRARPSSRTSCSRRSWTSTTPRSSASARRRMPLP